MSQKRRKPELSKADYELLAEFRFTLRTFLGFSEEAALKHGVTAIQYQALLAIAGFPRKDWVSVGELAEQLRTAHHSAVGLVDRMEELHLVARKTSKEDKRRVEVSLTAKGTQVLNELYRAHRRELNTIGPKLIGLLHKASQALPEE